MLKFQIEEGIMLVFCSFFFLHDFIAKFPNQLFGCVWQEAALSAEMNAKEGLRIAMDKQGRQFQKEIETLEFQVYFAFSLKNYRSWSEPLHLIMINIQFLVI